LNQPHHKPKSLDPTHYNAFSSPPAPHLFWTSLCLNLYPTSLKHINTAVHLYPTPLSHPRASHLHQKAPCRLQSATYHPCITQLTHLYPPQRSTHPVPTQSHLHPCLYSYLMHPLACHDSPRTSATTTCLTPTRSLSCSSRCHFHHVRTNFHLGIRGFSHAPGHRHSRRIREPCLNHHSCCLHLLRPMLHLPQFTFHLPQPTLHLPQPTLHSPQPVAHLSVPVSALCHLCTPRSRPTSPATSSTPSRISWTSMKDWRISTGFQAGRRWKRLLGTSTAPSVTSGKICQGSSTATGTTSTTSSASSTSAPPRKANFQDRSLSTSPASMPGSAWRMKLTSSTISASSTLKARFSSAQVG